MSEPRWFTDTSPDHSRRYVERFRQMAADGVDLDGEARFVDAMVSRQARILDAGCGGGRTGAALHARGHEVVGVDVDPELIAAAVEDHPGPQWIVRDLAGLGDPGSAGSPCGLGDPGDPGGDPFDEPFDAAVLAGNVLVYVTPGSERRVLAGVLGCVRPGGVVVTGFATDRAYSVTDLDSDLAALGIDVEHRFATWDLRPWHAGAGWAVSVIRVPG
jgi:SAM-dependent methyltransferase